MSVNPTVAPRPTVDDLIAWYGDGSDGATPTADQWRALLSREAASPLALINFFRLRETARYPEGTPEAGEALSGQAAFERYAAVSIPAMQAAGGSFLLVGPDQGSFIGPDEDWDVVAIGRYPDLPALLRLLGNPDYIACFRHRTAACAGQRVRLAAAG